MDHGCLGGATAQSHLGTLGAIDNLDRIVGAYIDLNAIPEAKGDVSRFFNNGFRFNEVVIKVGRLNFRGIGNPRIFLKHSCICCGIGRVKDKLRRTCVLSAKKVYYYLLRRQCRCQR